ncbi:MAG: hypothetical protein M5U28_16995 [Sandaracinaceae bacterium]|nr:hypothetical protein [Sandaracinaceae bacterium]
MARPRPAAGVFDRAPFILFWETTQACDLACRHCRACAVPDRDPDELTTEEGKALLAEARAMGCPVVVLTGVTPPSGPISSSWSATATSSASAWRSPRARPRSSRGSCSPS